MNGPYFLNQKIIPLDKSGLLNAIPSGHKVNESRNELSSAEVTRLINLYTPAGFLEAYERTGKFVFLYPVDHPLTPVLEVIENQEYHYYQKLI